MTLVLALSLAWAQDVCPDGSCTYSSLTSALGSNLDSIAVGPGLYVEDVHITRDVTLISTDGPQATWLTPASPGGIAVQLGGGAKVTLLGFRIDVFDGQIPLLVDDEGSNDLTGTELIVVGHDSGANAYIGLGNTARFENSLFTGLVGSAAGALHIAGAGSAVTVTDSLFVDNLGCDGGAIQVGGGSALTVFGALFQGNHAEDCTSLGEGGSGGAIQAWGAGSTQIEQSRFVDNMADTVGGHVVAFSRSLNIGNSLFSGGSAAQGGGAISQSDGALALMGGRLELNQATVGGALAYWSASAQKTLTVSGATFAENQAEEEGGAIAAHVAGTLVVDAVRFFENDAGLQGGALWVTGPGAVLVSQGVFDANSATNGAGVYAVDVGDVGGDALPSFVGNLFCANEASDDGGGLVVVGTGFDVDAVGITRNVFVENSAASVGGALMLSSSGLPVTNNHFLGNQASTGGAVYYDASTSGGFLHNLVAYNEGPAIQLRNANFAAYDYNMYWMNGTDLSADDGVPIPAGTQQVFGTDPEFVDYGANGVAGDCSNAGRFEALGEPPVDFGPNGWTDPESSSPRDIGAFMGGLELGVDADGDGYSVGYDCNDEPLAGGLLIHPGAIEICGSIDRDCDGVIGDLDPDAFGVSAFYPDLDGDGFGDADADAVFGCQAPVFHVSDASDCDDDDAGVRPDATDVLDDGIDQDCNGGDRVSCLIDSDRDGFGITGSFSLGLRGVCLTSEGRAPPTQSGDCHDGDPSRYPGAPEVPDDGIDQDCNGADAESCFEDSDGDGFGNNAASAGQIELFGCTDAQVHRAGDCDDTDGAVNPDATELIDTLVDEDCDGFLLLTCFEDRDSDQHGGATVEVKVVSACTDAGLLSQPGDCDDDAISVFPGASEVPDDGIDQDCNGHDAQSCWPDGDGDGYGAGPGVIEQLGCSDDQAVRDGDCDDATAAVAPGAPEVPDDGIDQDCSGADTVTCYIDLDQDGYGQSSTVLAVDGSCDVDEHEAVVSGDCNDDLAQINPGRPDVPDNPWDEDCSGAPAITCFEDLDRDGQGSNHGVVAQDGSCDRAQAESYLSGDCNDDDASINETATEIPYNDVDENCDGLALTDVDGDGFAGGDLGDDCDDGDLSVNPAAFDVPDDEIDQDCNGMEARSFVAGGVVCSTATPLGTGWLLLAGLGLLTRRRSPRRTA